MLKAGGVWDSCHLKSCARLVTRRKLAESWLPWRKAYADLGTVAEGSKLQLLLESATIKHKAEQAAAETVASTGKREK